MWGFREPIQRTESLNGLSLCVIIKEQNLESNTGFEVSPLFFSFFVPFRESRRPRALDSRTRTEHYQSIRSIGWFEQHFVYHISAGVRTPRLFYQLDHQSHLTPPTPALFSSFSLRPWTLDDNTHTTFPSPLILLTHHIGRFFSGWLGSNPKPPDHIIRSMLRRAPQHATP